MRVLMAGTTCLVVCFLQIGSADAQTYDQNWVYCWNMDQKFAWDQSIAGCSSIIQTGKEKDGLKNAYYQRGNGYLRKSEIDRAIIDYDEALRLEPAYNPALISRGIALSAKKEYSRAIADLEKAIRFEPSRADAFLNRGIAYLHQMDFVRAIADFDHAIRVNAEYGSYYDVGLGVAGKQRADPDIGQTIQLDPQLADVYLYRGKAYLQKQDYLLAVADFDQAIRLTPEYASAYFYRGLAKSKIGRAAEGDADIAKARKLNPKVGE